MSSILSIRLDLTHTLGRKKYASSMRTVYHKSHIFECGALFCSFCGQPRGFRTSCPNVSVAKSHKLNIASEQHPKCSCRAFYLFFPSELSNSDAIVCFLTVGRQQTQLIVHRAIRASGHSAMSLELFLLSNAAVDGFFAPFVEGFSFFGFTVTTFCRYSYQAGLVTVFTCCRVPFTCEHLT